MQWQQIETMPGYFATYRSANIRLCFKNHSLANGLEVRQWEWFVDGRDQRAGSAHSIVNQETLAEQIGRAVEPYILDSL